MVALFAQQLNTHLPIDEVMHGDCLEALRTLPDNSVDAIVSDPPAGIAFMGKNWDDPKAESWGAYDSPYARGNTPRYKTTEKGVRDAFIAFMTEVFTEALRCLKPGGYGLIWSLPRTSHWTALALEDAGFIVKDCVSHIFGSGFPKSMDISKAIDRMAGAEREVIGQQPIAYPDSDCWGTPNKNVGPKGSVNTYGEYTDRPAGGMKSITAPATPEAQQHAGKGTALKPSTEFWWLVQKPISEKTIAANVLRWNCGALNIDATRISTQENLNGGAYSVSPREDGKSTNKVYGMYDRMPEQYKQPQGRFPSHLLLSHSVWCVPRGVKRVSTNRWGKDKPNVSKQSSAIFGNGKPGVSTPVYGDADGMEEIEDWECVEDCPVYQINLQTRGTRADKPSASGLGGWRNQYVGGDTSAYYRGTSYHDEGGASRYFQTFHYFSKASRAERNQGCEGLPERSNQEHEGRKGQLNSQFRPDGSEKHAVTHTNNHPTVKSLSLMSWLCRLITPPDGIVLDPFLGSGSTAVAAIHEGFHFIGIEAEAEYVAICEARIAHAMREVS